MLGELDPVEADQPCYPHLTRLDIDGNSVDHLTDVAFVGRDRFKGRGPGSHMNEGGDRDSVSAVRNWSARIAAFPGFRDAVRLSWDSTFSRLRPRLAKIRQKILQAFKKYVLRPLKPFPKRKGVLFIGYVEAGLGLAESLRGLVSAVAQRRMDFGIYPYRVGVESRIIGEFMPERYDRDHRYDISVTEVTVDQLATVFAYIDPRLTTGSYRILRTYWELPQAPKEWAPLLSQINEMWVPNQFVHDAFKGIFSGPITIIPPCVVVKDADYPDRESLGMDEKRFYFLFSFDYFSSPHRKNPLGVLEAFQKAFPDRDDNVGLIIKSTGAETHHPDIKEKIRLAVEVDPRIRVIDTTMSRREVLGLIRACDCYVSLHRAEGFGLGMVEAMTFGNVVVGTDFSGSKDFLSEATGFPIAYDMRPVEPHEYIWSENQFWAEPRMESAVEAFKLVFGDRELRERKAAAGKILVDEKYSKVSVGAAVESRIREITRSRQ